MKRIGIILAVAVLLVAVGSSKAEDGVLLASIVDKDDRPLKGIVLSPRAGGQDGTPSTDAGKTRIRLAPGTRVGTRVSLVIVSPKQPERIFVSPRDKTVNVPPYDDEASNYVTIWLAKRGDKVILENRKAVVALASNIIDRTAISQALNPNARDDSLAQFASEWGFTVQDVTGAIRSLQASPDAFDKGISLLFEGRRNEALTQLRAAYDLSIKWEHASFLAMALSDAGNLKEACEKYAVAVALRPNDLQLMIRFARSLDRAGLKGQSKEAFQRARDLEAEVASK